MSTATENRNLRTPTDIPANAVTPLAKQLTAADGTPSQDEINEVMVEAEESGSSRWPGMTYEQGVAAALRWMIDGGENPMED